MINVDVSQVNKLVVDLAASAGSVSGRAAAIVAKTAMGAEATSKALAPVDTGNLRNSISTDTTYGGLRAEIGPTADYGAFVEYGTSRMSPQPYMGPALATHGPGMVTAFQKLVGDLL